MKRFRYHAPGTLADASAILLEFGETAQLLAGGTDLLVEIKEGLRSTAHVVDLKGIRDLDEISYSDEEGLRFGALATARSLETSLPIIAHYPNFLTALRQIGSIQIRNRATVTGNICRASPSADTLPPLIADDARIEIHSPSGTREQSLAEFFTGPGRTRLAPGEIVTAVRVPAPRRGSGRAYIKHGRRKAMELATVGVAVSLTVDGNRCRDIRIALGAVAPTPVRAHAAEAVLVDRQLTPATVAEAAEAAMAQSTPISNVRASADYRRQMVGVLTRRAIDLAMGGAQ